MIRQRQTPGIAPVYDKNSEMLILGSYTYCHPTFTSGGDFLRVSAKRISAWRAIL